MVNGDIDKLVKNIWNECAFAYASNSHKWAIWLIWSTSQMNKCIANFGKPARAEGIGQGGTTKGVHEKLREKYRRYKKKEKCAARESLGGAICWIGPFVSNSFKIQIFMAGKGFVMKRYIIQKKFRYINKGFSDFKEKFSLWRHAAL